MTLTENNNLMTLGGRIMLARENHNLTERQLSGRLGVLVKTVRNWESDRSEPRGNKLTTLSGVLGVSLGWLVTGENTDAAGPASKEETRLLQVKMGQLLAMHEQSTALILEIQADVNHLQEQFERIETESADEG